MDSKEGPFAGRRVETLNEYGAIGRVLIDLFVTIDHRESEVERNSLRSACWLGGRPEDHEIPA
jgi:hypothetical protein